MDKPWCTRLEDYAVAAESGTRRVVMAKGLAKDFRKIAAKDQGQLKRWMEIWTGDHEGAISTERFKSQESFTDVKGRKVQIWAFKSYQARIYGFVRTVEGKETFLAGAIDPSKKNDNADKNNLKRASNEAFRVLDALGIR